MILTKMLKIAILPTFFDQQNIFHNIINKGFSYIFWRFCLTSAFVKKTFKNILSEMLIFL
jgi:hypothetical protein